MKTTAKTIANVTRSIVNWFVQARPDRGTQSFNAQMGTHFEEVGEMLAELEGQDGQTRTLIELAKQAVNNLGTHLKANSNELLVVIPEENRIRYLDALCDQSVTLIGCAHDAQMDIHGGLKEVAASNWSKFVDGKAVFDANGKIAKGPNYFKADLSKYV